MTTPLVSLIIPVYNVAPYVRQCMQSAVSQTLRDIEIIVVDDCGTDDSMRIVNEFAARDNRVRILRHEKNLGLGAARNTALRHARAPYIMFLDSDDWYAPDMCEKMYNAITENKTDCAACDMTLVDDKTGRTKPGRANAGYNVGVKKIDFQIGEIISVVVWNKIWSKKILDDWRILFPEGVRHEDDIFSRKYYLCAKTISFVDESLYNYRVRPGSIMTSLRLSSEPALDILIGAGDLWNFICRNNFGDDARRFFWRWYNGLTDAAVARSHGRAAKIACGKYAGDFVRKNYTPGFLSPYEAHGLISVLNGRYTRNVFGVLNIVHNHNRDEVLILNVLSLYKAKYGRDGVKYYLFGLPVWRRAGLSATES